MKNFKLLLMVLVVQTLGCGQAADMLDEVISAIAQGNLPRLQKHLTGKALEQMKTPADLKPWAEIIQNSRRREFSADSIYSWENGKVLVTAYGAFQKSATEVVWADFKLECAGLTSISDDHPFPTECKISEFGQPMTVQTSFAKTLVLLYAYSCASQPGQNLLLEELQRSRSVNPKLPAFPNGPSAVDTLKDRWYKEHNSNYCQQSYQKLR